MLVNNDVVSLDWDQKGFFSKDKGLTFFAAVQAYLVEVDGESKEIGLVFFDQKLYVAKPATADDNFRFEDLWNSEDVVKQLTRMAKKTDDETGDKEITLIDLFEDEFLEVGDAVELSDKGEEFGLEAHWVDIKARQDDLGNYFMEVTESF